jgi:TRAP-type C4-dicarboxylate transport system permease small subunit
MQRALDKVVNAVSIIAAVWLMLIAVVIFLEVTGRGIFNVFLGGDEIVTNSVPAIVFLQVPLAIRVGSMLRTTIVFDHLGKRGRHIINGLSYMVALVLFVAIAVGGWEDMIKGWEIREFQGIGALEVPVYPIRTIIIGSAILTVLVYSTMLVRVFTGRDDTPGAQGPEGEQAEGSHI